MQLKTSFFNKSLFKRFMKKNLVVGVIYFILLFIFGPYEYLANINSAYLEFPNTNLYNSYLCNSFCGDGFEFFVVVIVFFLLMLNFWFLYSKRDSYMMHAFPVNRKQLFFTGIAATDITVIIPVLLNAILATIIALATGATTIGVIWNWTYVMVGQIIFFSGFSMLTMMLTGQLFTACFFYVVLNVVFFGMEYVLRTVEEVIGFGLNNFTNELPFRVTTPVAYILNYCFITKDETYDKKGEYITQLTITYRGVGMMAIYIIVGIAFTALAYYLYKIKKIETVNDFINAPGIKAVFTVGMTFFISVYMGTVTIAIVAALNSLNYNASVACLIISTIIYGIIIYYSIQMLIEKTVRVFTKKNVIYCTAYSIAAIIVILGIRFDVLGIETKIPDVDDIEFAAIAGDNPYVFDDADDINEVIAIQQTILADKTEIREFSNASEATYFDFKYKLKDGSTIYREYMLVNPDKVNSDSYTAVCDKLLGFMNDPEVVKRHAIAYCYDDCDVTNLDFTAYKYDENQDCYIGQDVLASFDSDDEKQEAINEVYAAVLKDIDEGNLLQTKIGYVVDEDESALYNDFSIEITGHNGKWLTDTDRYYDWNIDYGDSAVSNYAYIQLNKDCTNTINALIKNGFCTEDDIVTYVQANE